MEKNHYSISRELINEIATILGSLPYAQVAAVIGKMQSEVSPQEITGKAVPTPPAAS